MKVKGDISICTAIMLNDHSNPYIESTIVLSNIISSVVLVLWRLTRYAET